MKAFNLKNREQYEDSIIRQGYEVDYHINIYESSHSGVLVSITMHMHEVGSREIVYVTKIDMDTNKGDFVNQDLIIDEIVTVLENWDGCLAD